MKGRNLTAFLMLLVFAAACFVSAPVSSGEHPWDADDPVDQGKSDTITDDSLCGGVIGENGSPDWWWLISNTAMYYLTGVPESTDCE